MYAQSGSVSDANARLPKMTALQNTIPVSSVFIGKAPRYVRHISLGEDVKNVPLVLRHRSQGRFAAVRVERLVRDPIAFKRLGSLHSSDVIFGTRFRCRALANWFGEALAIDQKLDHLDF
jgi:hypothetical protein